MLRWPLLATFGFRFAQVMANFSEHSRQKHLDTVQYLTHPNSRVKLQRLPVSYSAHDTRDWLAVPILASNAACGPYIHMEVEAILLLGQNISTVGPDW